MNRLMNPGELENHIHAFLAEHHEGSLATCLNNVPRSSPVQYFLGNELEIFIYSAGGSKFDALRQNPNVCLLVNTPYLSYRKIKGVQVFGTALTSLTHPGLKEEAAQFAPSSEYTHQDVEDLYVIKIFPKKIVYLDSLQDGKRTKQIFKSTKIPELV